MPRPAPFSYLTAFALVGCASAGAAPPEGEFQRLLDTRRIGAAAFVRAHPEWDGRGSVIAVLDTGVDMGAPGLRKTTDGKPKVIVARDFSGQGTIALSVAERVVIDGVSYLKTDEVSVRGAAGLPKPAKGDFLMGVIHESAFRNSDVSDLNGNGTSTDEFVVLTAETAEGYVAWIDVGGDGDVSDALKVESYAVHQQTFGFPMKNPKEERPPMTFALHIEDGGSVVEICFDDGGHGTHVAGIAAGHDLMDRAGFDGVAPGAQILALKIGDNTLAGGSTTSDSMRRALEFAGEWSKEHSVVVVANISYGIGAENEGQSDIDVAVDELMARFPKLVVAVSAGNEGPGISTVGTPAGSRFSTAAAAMLPEGAAETLFGSRIDGDQVFMFSSRGGESAKPDVLAPGVATSSTPRWDAGDVKGGTSMAAPEITGAYALLASAASAFKVDVTSTILKRALLASARPIAGYGLLDQGAGVPDIGRAFDLVEKMAGHGEPFRVAGYRVATTAPTSEDEVEGALWRAGTFLPSGQEGHTFTIEPVFFGESSSKDAEFHQVIRLESQAPWIDLERRELRLRGKDAETVIVHYDPDALRTPGIYSGRVLGTPDDGGGVPAFALWSTVVVPHTFSAADRYALSEEVRLAPGAITRFPLLVPPGATSLSITVSPGDDCGIRLYAYDPAGRPVEPDATFASSQDATTASLRIGEETLVPGTWEIVLYAQHRQRKASTATLDVQFRGLDFQPIRTLTFPPGGSPAGRVAVTNRYDMRFQGSVSGSVTGFRKQHRLTADGDLASMSFTTNADITRVDFDLRMDARTYGRFTDVAIILFDDEGKAVEKDGFVNGRARIGISTEGGTKGWRLEIRGAAASSDSHSDAWSVGVVETWSRKEPISVRGQDVTLWPSVTATLEFDLETTPPRTPDGYETTGSLVLTERRTNDVWAEIPIRLK